MRVLLTSPRAPVTLDLARRFHAHGDEVYLCDSLRFGCGNFSRSKIQAFSTPRPNAFPADYVEAINRIVNRQGIDLLVPTCEEIFFLAACRNQLDCEVFAGSFETLRDIHNKWTFSQMASNEAGIVPDTYPIQSESQLIEFRDCSRNFVFKPVYSRFASQTLIQPNREQLACVTASEKTPWIAQRFVPGTEYSTYSVARRGQLVAHCTYQSSFRAGIGAGICFQAKPNSSILEFTHNFVRQFEFTGQIGFDFIVNEGGEVWVLEGNPRATSGLHCFDSCLLIDAILGRTDVLLEAGPGSSHMIGAAMLLLGFQDAMAKRSLLRYLRNVFTSKDVIFRWTDPLPWLGIPFTAGELCWVALRERKTLQQASTYDIEWNGEAI